MVNVITNGLLDGVFTKLFKELFIISSVKPLKKTLCMPSEMREYLDLLYRYTNSGDYKLKPFNARINSYKMVENNDVLCAFSGGKDSVANVLLLIEMGYNPILFFVKGINRSYPMELDIAKRLSLILDCELVVKSITVNGKCDFIENPTKDQFILSMMVDYGIKRDISKYSFGCVYTDNIDTISSEYMLSDAYEMFMAIEKFYQYYIENFKIILPLKNETQSICEILKYDISLLYDTYSCMTPLRYKNNIINTNKKKYDINIPNGRCYSCYKCCQEALVLNAVGVVDFEPNFIKHCKDVISNIQTKFDNTANAIDNKDWVDNDVIEQYRGQIDGFI